MKYNQYLMLKEDDDFLKKGANWVGRKIKNSILSGHEKRKMEKYMRKVASIIFSGNGHGVLYKLIIKRLVKANSSYKKYDGVNAIIENAKPHFAHLAAKYKILYNNAIDEATDAKNRGDKEEGRQYILALKEDIVESFKTEVDHFKKSIIKVLEDFDKVLLSIIDSKEVLKLYPKKQDYLRIVWRGIYSDVLTEIEDLYQDFKHCDEYRDAHKIYILAKTEVENVLVSETDMTLNIAEKSNALNSNGGIHVVVQVTTYGRQSSLVKKCLLIADDPDELDKIEDIHDITGAPVRELVFSGKLFAQNWATIVTNPGKDFYLMGYVVTKRGAFIKSNIMYYNNISGNIEKI